MRPRAKALRSAVAAAVGPGKVDAALRAVVEELGVTEENVSLLESCGDDLTRRGYMRDGLVHQAAICFATLLEASGADR